MGKHLFPEKLQIYKTLVSKTSPEEITPKETKTVVYDTIIKRVIVDTMKNRTLKEHHVEHLDNEEVEFFIEPEEVEEVLMLDRMLNNKKITVKVKQNQEDTPVTPPFSTFDVQQWSTPIKNSITYQNMTGVLKIKGMDINSIDIYFAQGRYYLYDGFHYYAIQESKNYENLVVADFPF